MPSGLVDINGADYILKPFFAKDAQGRNRRYYVRHYTYEQTVQTTTTLEASPDARGGVTPFKFYPPYYGMGRRRILLGMEGKPDPKDLFRYWDSQDMMTWWSAQVTLGLTKGTSTDATNDERVRGAVAYKGDIWTLWEDSTTIQDGAGDDYTNQVRSRKYTGSSNTWSGGGVLDRGETSGSTGDVTAEVVGLDVQAPGANLIALAYGKFKGTAGGGYVTHLNIFTSDDGADWTIRETPLTMTNVPAANEDIDAGLVAPRQIAGESIAAFWDEGDGILLQSERATDDVTWSDEVTIASGGGPKGIAVYPGIDGASKLLLGTREGLYEVDTSPSTWTYELIYPMTAHDHNCRRMVVHNGALWFPIGVDATEPAGMVRMTVAGDLRTFEVNETTDGVFLAPAAGDTVPARLMGPIRFMWSTGKFLYASIGGGGSSQNAWIMRHNGFGFHNAAEHGTVNKLAEIVMVSGDDDGTTRLHWSIKDGSADSDTYYQVKPESNPVDGQTYSYETNGYIDLPEINLQTPDVNKNILDLHLDAADLSGSTSGEYINVDYELDGATIDGTPDLGNFLSGTKTVDFGSSSEGVSGLSVQWRENFVRDGGSTADTPKRRVSTIRMKPRFPTLNGYQMIVDVRATAENNGDPNNLKAVIDDLETARDSVPMVAFQYSPIASTFGEVIIDETTEDIESDVTDDTVTADRIAVEVSLRVEER